MSASELEALRYRLNEVVDSSLPTVKIVAICVSLLVALGAVVFNLVSPPGPDLDSLPQVERMDGVDSGDSSALPGSTGPGGLNSSDIDGEQNNVPVVVVQVAGAVHSPGVFTLNAGQRVNDAVELAGGLTTDADIARVNLAAKVADGQQIVVPKVGEALVAVTDGVAAGGDATTEAGSGARINVNTANAKTLEGLPGIGPSLAEAIIDHRKRNGPFKSVDQLNDVKGIGDAKFAQLESRVSV